MRVQHAAFLVVATTVLVQSPSSAQHHEHSPGVVAREEYRQQVPGVPGKVARVAILEIAPKGLVSPHCHHGFEYGIVTRGILMVRSGSADFEVKNEGNAFSVG